MAEEAAAAGGTAAVAGEAVTTEPSRRPDVSELSLSVFEQFRVKKGDRYKVFKDTDGIWRIMFVEEESAPATEQGLGFENRMIKPVVPSADGSVDIIESDGQAGFDVVDDAGVQEFFDNLIDQDIANGESGGGTVTPEFASADCDDQRRRRLKRNASLISKASSMMDGLSDDEDGIAAARTMTETEDRQLPLLPISDFTDFPFSVSVHC